jgi:MYXO-CTERM domain-containing protein
MSLGVRVLSPSRWTATTGSQTAELMVNFDPDGQTSWVRVRPATNVASTSFLTALMPVATSSWSSRTRVDALDPSDSGAGAVVAPGSALEERWIFTRAGTDKTAGDLVLHGAFAGMAGRDASGIPVRAVLFGAGSIRDQSGGRPLLSSATANAIEVKLVGTTLDVTGDGIADFQAYAPTATAATVNGYDVQATFEAGMVTFRTASGGGSGAGAPDGGSCGNCIPPPATVTSPEGAVSSDPAPGGCSHSAETAGWLGALGALALAFRRRR